MDYSWKIKTWKFTASTMEQARANMEAWIERNRGRVQYEEIFVDNAFAVQYRRLMRVY